MVRIRWARRTHGECTITGSAEVGGRPDLSGDIKGTVSGNSITYNLTSGFGSQVSLTVSGNRMQGNIGGQQVMLQESQ